MKNLIAILIILTSCTSQKQTIEIVKGMNKREVENIFKKNGVIYEGPSGALYGNPKGTKEGEGIIANFYDLNDGTLVEILYMTTNNSERVKHYNEKKKNTGKKFGGILAGEGLEAVVYYFRLGPKGQPYSGKMQWHNTSKSIEKLIIPKITNE